MGECDIAPPAFGHPWYRFVRRTDWILEATDRDNGSRTQSILHATPLIPIHL